MLKNFRLKNFQSYLEDTYVDLEVSKKTPHSYFDYETEGNSRISKVMCVFGANGAGKSNLLKPLSFTAWFATMSFSRLEAGDYIPVLSHFSAKDKPTEFEVEFLIPKRCDRTRSMELEYKYGYILNKDKVLKEELKFKNPDTKLYNRVFSRYYNEESETYIFKKSNDFPVNTSLMEKCPENCSLISYINRLVNDNELKEHHLSDIQLVHSYFGITTTNLSFSGKNKAFSDKSITKLLDSKPVLFEKVKSLLSSYDIGIKDIRIDSKEVINNETGEVTLKKVPTFIHECDGEDYELPLWLQSSGTQSAYVMITYLVEKLYYGGIAVLDEFDNDFNPLLTLELLELFKHENDNVSNAQLIFTTHTPQVLNVLRKQHVHLVEKFDNRSEVWRVDEIEGIRDRDNLYAKYISGILGGVPNFD